MTDMLLTDGKSVTVRDEHIVGRSALYSALRA
jgi:hypothetical protein